MDFDLELWIIVMEDVDGVDFDLSFRNFKIFILSGEFVGALAVYFDGGEAGWGLGYFTNKRLTKFTNLGSFAM